MPTHQLLFGSTLWSFEGVCEPVSSGLDRLGGAGFHVLETNQAGFSDPAVTEAVRRQHLQCAYQCYPNTVDDLQASLVEAKRLRALHVNAHAASPHLDEDAAVALINGMYDAADAAGVKLLLETHRGRITQDLYRTGRLCERIERLRLTLDVSHYIVCEEHPGPDTSLKHLFDPLLDRVEIIHGRISNGQQVQVDIGDGSNELARRYVVFWAEAMRRWQKRSRAGSALVFTPELGPPDYAIRDPRTGQEVSDRWQQSLVLKRLAQEAWALAKSSSNPIY